MNIATIFVPVIKLKTLDYLIPEDMHINTGDIVIVPFQTKQLFAIVYNTKHETKCTKLLKSIEKNTQFSVNNVMLKLIKCVADYYMSHYGTITKLVLPVNINNNITVEQATITTRIPQLSSEQQNILLQLIQATNKPTVLKGVTGSGKTEIYFHLIHYFLHNTDKQILVLLPEIALTNQIVKRFTDSFKLTPVIWHSSITSKQKEIILRNILLNKNRVIFGTRSAIFLPYNKLGLIIIDEEHDVSYKQDTNIMYNARDVAILRAHLSNIQIVLCSATPSIETLYNINTKQYNLIELHSRYNNATLPIIEIINMRNNAYPLSQQLINKIHNKLLNKEQILLFLNRTGYATSLLCNICGHKITCKFCSTWMVVHKSHMQLKCHHCGYHKTINSSCEQCKQKSLIMCGIGIEKLFEKVTELFPNNKIATISAHNNVHEISQILYNMEKNTIDILIGTQIITKGYHFPNLTLVGILNADMNLSGPGDLISTERVYQILHQVGGRSGREQKQGLVMIQTYNPEDIIFHALKDHNETQFIKYELQSRLAASMPPFTKLALLILQGCDANYTLNIAKAITSVAPIDKNIKIFGPAQAIIWKISNKYRYKILVVTHKTINIQKYLRTWLALIKIPSKISLKINIDPQNCGL